ncbi:MAG: DUF6497 family protein [Alkalilacustris sp.]
MVPDDDPRIRLIARLAFAAGIAFALLVAAIALSPRAEPSGLPDGPLEVPSRQLVTLQEAFWEEQEDGAIWLRLRFVAPRIGSGPGEYGFDLVEWDMVHLCETLGIPWAEEGGAELIVVSFAAEPLEFGAANPDVAQFFEAYRPVDGECAWEEF